MCCFYFINFSINYLLKWIYGIELRTTLGLLTWTLTFSAFFLIDNLIKGVYTLTLGVEIETLA